MDEQWIENLRKRFKDKTEPAPDGLWNSLEAAMASADVANRKQKTDRSKAKAVPLWGKSAAAAAACVLLLLGAAFLFMKNTDTGNIKENTSATGMTANSSPASEQTTRQSTKPATEFDKMSNNMARHIAAAVNLISGREGHVIPDKNLTVAAETEPNVAEIKSEKPINQDKKADDNSMKQSNGSSRTKSDMPFQNNGDALLSMTTSSRKSGSRIAVGLYGANLTSLGSSTGNSIDALSSIQYDAVGEPSNMFLLSSALREEGRDNTAATKAVKVKHRQPIRAGVSVGFGITDRLTMTTGLNYSYLSSDITAGDAYSGMKTDQRLHFIGLPLALTYKVWGNRNISVYATAGGGIDFCVGGKSHSEYLSGGIATETSDEDTRDSRPQWSVNAAAGVQYNFTPLIGVYVEPGLGYYFDNHSDVTTIYKDKPVNFNLSLGLRLMLNNK